MLPLVIIFEPLSECMVIGACTAWAVSVLFQWDVLGFYLVHILVWFLLDWILLSVVQVYFINVIYIFFCYRSTVFSVLEWFAAV